MTAPQAPAIAHKVILSSVLTVMRQGITIASGIVVARLAGPEILGTLAYAVAFVGLFSSLADLGFGTAHIKRIAEGHDLGQCMGMMWLTKACAVVLMIVTVLAVLYTGGDQSFITPQGRAVFYLALAGAIAAQLSQVLISTLAAQQDVVRKDLAPVIVQGANAVVRVPVIIRGLGAVGLAAVDLGSATLSLGVYAWLLRKLPLAWPSRYLARKYVNFAAPTFVIGLLTSVGENLDRVLLQTFAGAVAVGQYSVGMRIGMSLQFVSQTVAGLVFPSLSRAYALGRPDEALALSGRAERRLALVLFPVLLAIAGLAGPIAVVMLGKQYADSGPVIVLGTAAMVLQILAQPYRQMIAGAERMRLMIIGHVVIFAVQGAALLLFLGVAEPFPGLEAAPVRAAAAIVAGSLIGLTFWQVAVWRSLSASADLGLWVHVGSGLLLSTVAYVLAQDPGGAAWGRPLLASCTAVLTHLAVLRLSGEFGASEVHFLMGIASAERFRQAAQATFPSPAPE